jgi:hypothetical protein
MKTKLAVVSIVLLLAFRLFADETLATLTTNSVPTAQSGDEMANLAKELSNPVASLISVPIQNNFDFGGGPADHGFQYKVNLQPVIPIAISSDWNLIARVIVPYVYQHDRIGNTTQSGLADTTASFFFSPRQPGPGGMIWGVGPDIYLPTATDSLLGSEKWGAGPTAVFLWQKSSWTYGALVNQIWSFAGDAGRPYMNNTFMQPFLAYQTKTHTTFTIDTESTYNWEAGQWTVPLNWTVSQVTKIGKMPVSFQAGVRYYAAKPDGGPDWGLRFTVTFLFPK